MERYVELAVKGIPHRLFECIGMGERQRFDDLIIGFPCFVEMNERKGASFFRKARSEPLATMTI